MIAQDEATSVVWGMPGAAAATNQVDEILPLERIGPTARLATGARENAMKLTPAAFNDIRKAVHDLCGNVIAEDKQYLVKARLEPILRMNGLASYELLVQRLKQPNSLLLRDQMIEAITTNETSFNRDGHPFEELRRIYSSNARASTDRTEWQRHAFLAQRLRIWCAAVANGQEAYSVAMAVTDFLTARSVPGSDR